VNWKTIISKVILVVIVEVSCSTILFSQTNEPSYQGRSLSEWLTDFDNRNLSQQSHNMAAEAVRHIGSPALPILMERLGEVRSKKFKLELQEWRNRPGAAEDSIARPVDPRLEALAGLDALGSEAAGALPALGKLLKNDPPDLCALYVAARIGPAGVPLLRSSLTNEVKAVRLAAEVCLDMISSHSEVLYPSIPVGPDAPSFDRRRTEFNLKVMQAAFEGYKKEHPEMGFPNGQFDKPPPVLPPSIPVPVQ